MTDQEDQGDARSQLRAIERQLRQHPGWVAHQRWQELRRTVDVHWRNLAALEDVLKVPGDNPQIAFEIVQNVRPPAARQEYVALVDQQLHNALASAVTLVDHTRRLVEDYPDTDFAREFEQRNGAIRDDPHAAFLRRLRNYLLHYGVLPFAHRLSMDDMQAPGGGTFNFIVLLDRNSLRLWDDWTAGARTFLDSAPEKIDLLELISWYRSVTVDLYHWVFEQFNHQHDSDIAALNELIRQRNLLASGGQDDGSGDDSSSP